MNDKDIQFHYWRWGELDQALPKHGVSFSSSTSSSSLPPADLNVTSQVCKNVEEWDSLIYLALILTQKEQTSSNKDSEEDTRPTWQWKEELKSLSLHVKFHVKFKTTLSFVPVLEASPVTHIKMMTRFRLISQLVLTPCTNKDISCTVPKVTKETAWSPKSSIYKLGDGSTIQLLLPF